MGENTYEAPVVNTLDGNVVLCQEKVQIKYNQFSLFM